MPGHPSWCWVVDMKDRLAWRWWCKKRLRCWRRRWSGWGRSTSRIGWRIIATWGGRPSWSALWELERVKISNIDFAVWRLLSARLQCEQITSWELPKGRLRVFKKFTFSFPLRNEDKEFCFKEGCWEKVEIILGPAFSCIWANRKSLLYKKKNQVDRAETQIGNYEIE